MSRADHFQFPFAQGFDDKWHVRRSSARWKDYELDAVCGRIESVHVSEFPPVLMDAPKREKKHCRVCFP